MPVLDAEAIQTLHLLAQDGVQHIPADSGMGQVRRPAAHGQYGGRVATPETLFDFFINTVADPDEALAADPNFLTRLYQHPDVCAAFEKRALTVAQFEERVEANPDAPNQKLAEHIAEEIGKIWRQIPKREHLYLEMQRAVLEGGQGHEFVWHREADGTQRPVQFFPVHKSRFMFDRLGNLALLTRQTPVWGSYVKTEEQDKYLNRALPAGKFIYHVHKRRPGTWQQTNFEGYIYFGQGEDVALYYVVSYDYFVLRYRMKYISKFGQPPYVLYHNQNESPANIKYILDCMMGESFITVPKLPAGTNGDGKNAFYAIDPLEVPTAQQDWFENFQEKYTKPRIYSILLGQADANSRDEHGGYSSDVHRHDTGPSILFKFDAKNISGTLNAQLFPAMTLHRFPGLPSVYWPLHKLEAKEERDRSQEMEVAEKFSQMAPIAEEELYERGGFRKPAPGEKTIGGQAPGQDPFSVPQMPPMGKPGQQQPQPPQGAPKPGKFVSGMGEGRKPQNETGKPAGPIGQAPAKQKPVIKQRTMPRFETAGA